MRALIAALFLLASPATAECIGQNLLETMPAPARDALESAARAVPYPEGNFWLARKDDMQVTLVGTYHLGDPRHDANFAALSPRIVKAATVLVEAGPDEEKALMDRVARDPSVIVSQGATLPELLTPADWTLLSEALTKRGIPPFVAAKFRPWYVTMMLAIPACDLKDIGIAKGLDGMVIEYATAIGRPVRALEPYDTVFRLFDSMTLDEVMGLIRSTLAMEDRAADYSVTLADTYFDQKSRLIWELMRAESLALPGYTPEKVAAEFAAMEEAMMSARNRAWIPVIERAAQDGPVFAAFGALHIPGHDGVAALMERAGWTLERLPAP